MTRVPIMIALCALVAALAVAQTGPPGGGPPGQGMRGGFAPPPFQGDSTAAERDSLMNVVMKAIAGKEQMAAESVFKDIQSLKGRRAADVPRVMNYGYGRSLGVSCFHCHAKDDWAKSDKKQKQIARDMQRMVLAINTDYLWKIEGLGEGGMGGASGGPPGGGMGGPPAGGMGGPPGGGMGGPPGGGMGGASGGPRRPSVNCSTCHRGSIHANPDMGRMGSARPGGEH